MPTLTRPVQTGQSRSRIDVDYGGLAPEGAGYLSHIFPVTLLMGTGAGLCFPALMALAMSSATTQGRGTGL